MRCWLASCLGCEYIDWYGWLQVTTPYIVMQSLIPHTWLILLSQLCLNCNAKFTWETLPFAMQLYVSLCKFTIQDPAEKPIVSMACHLATASLSWVPLPRTHELARPILSDPVSASTRENPENQGLKTGSLVRLHVTIVTLHGPQRLYLEKMQKNAETRED